jgi:hypothetical protein
VVTPDVECAGERTDAVGKVKQTRATRRSVVLDRDEEMTVFQIDACGHERGSSPGSVLDRLGDGHVGRRLNRERLALWRHVAELHRQRRLVREGREHHRQARFGEDRRVDAVGELAQLVQRGGGLVAGCVEQGDQVFVAVTCGARARETTVSTSRVARRRSTATAPCATPTSG